MMSIHDLALKYEPYVISTRRAIHEHPELGLKEFETTKLIVRELESLGIEVQTFEGITGCVGIIRGGKPGRTVMLRADIDALPMDEADKTKSYCSKVPGVMHACGHDCHTAMLLGAAHILVEKKDELCGTVKLLFQMAEEIAKYSEEYIKRGALRDVDAIFGMHIWNNLSVGEINFEYGERMACSDKFTITIKGEAAHGSTPHLGKDAIAAAANCIMNLQMIPGRINNAQQSMVLTVGMVNGGTKNNIIADHVEIVGGVRAFDNDQRKFVAERIEKIAEESAAVLGCEAECDYFFGCSPVVNRDRALVDLAVKVGREVVGENAQVPLKKMGGAEDFSEYMKETRAVFGYLGSRNEAKGITAPHHSVDFDVDEDVLKDGMEIYARFAMEFLENNI